MQEGKKAMRWSYKTVHFELKKEGLLGSAFLDESEIEQELNEYGRAGWEVVSMLDTGDGLIAVFKQPLAVPGSDFQPPPVEEQQPPMDEVEESWEASSSVSVVAEDEPVFEEKTAEPVTAERSDSRDEAATDIGAIRIE